VTLKGINTRDQVKPGYRIPCCHRAAAFGLLQVCLANAFLAAAYMPVRFDVPMHFLLLHTCPSDVMLGYH